MKNFKRVVSGCLVSIFILSAGTLPAYAYNPYDGNYRDTVCTVKAINNSDGTLMELVSGKNEIALPLM